MQTTTGTSGLSWRPVDSFARHATASGLGIVRPCPVCDSWDAEVVFGLSDFQFFTDSATAPKRMDVVTRRCRACHGLYQSPGYSDWGFACLFAEAGLSYGHSTGRPAEQRAWLEARGLLASGRHVLDVGCGDGAFLAALPPDVRRTGLDVDRETIQRAERAWAGAGISFVADGFETFALPEPPDTITMFHVLEHLSRPRAALERLRAVAHADTRLVVEVPVVEQGATNDLVGFFSVQHQTHFSRRTLAASLARSGWRVLEAAAQPGYNGWRALAAPGAVEVPEAEAADPTHLAGTLGAWEEARRDVEAALAPLRSALRVVLWGGGMHTEMLYQATRFFADLPARRYAIVDTDPVKQGRTWRGIAIHPPAVLAGDEARHVPVIVSSYGSQEEIVAAATALGIEPARMVRLYRRVAVY